MADIFGTTVTTETRGGAGNLVLALFGGLAAAILGALLWMAVQVGLNLHSGIVAIAIGALVGFSIRTLGHGRSPVYGIIGAVLTLLSCLGGQILGILYLAATPEQGIFNLIVHTDYIAMVQDIFARMGPLGYVIYGIGVFEGYKLSIVK